MKADFNTSQMRFLFEHKKEEIEKGRQITSVIYLLSL